MHRVFDNFDNLTSRNLIYEYVLERDNRHCAYCNAYLSRQEITLDHIIPRAVGGLFTPANMTVACVSCNKEKDRQRFFNFIDSKNFKRSKYHKFQEAWIASSKTHPLYKIHKEARFCQTLIPDEMLGRYKRNFPIYDTTYPFDMNASYTGAKLQSIVEPIILKLERHVAAIWETKPEPRNVKIPVKAVKSAKKLCLICGSKEVCKEVKLRKNSMMENLSLLDLTNLYFCWEHVNRNDSVSIENHIESFVGGTFALTMFNIFADKQSDLIEFYRRLDSSWKISLPEAFFDSCKKLGMKEKRKIIMTHIESNLENYHEMVQRYVV
jgi:HNH endonuclease